MDPPNDQQASAEYYKARRPISDVSGFPESPSKEIDLETIHHDLEIMSSPFQQASQAELPDTPTQLHPAGSADIPSHVLRFSSDSRLSSDYGFYSGSNPLEDTRSGNSGRGYVSDTAGTIALSGGNLNGFGLLCFRMNGVDLLKYNHSPFSVNINVAGIVCPSLARFNGTLRGKSTGVMLLAATWTALICSDVH